MIVKYYIFFFFIFFPSVTMAFKVMFSKIHGKIDVESQFLLLGTIIIWCPRHMFPNCSTLFLCLLWFYNIKIGSSVVVHLTTDFVPPYIWYMILNLESKFNHVISKVILRHDFPQQRILNGSDRFRVNRF